MSTFRKERHPSKKNTQIDHPKSNKRAVSVPFVPFLDAPVSLRSNKLVLLTIWLGPLCRYGYYQRDQKNSQVRSTTDDIKSSTIDVLSTKCNSDEFRTKTLNRGTAISTGHFTGLTTQSQHWFLWIWSWSWKSQYRGSTRGYWLVVGTWSLGLSRRTGRLIEYVRWYRSVLKMGIDVSAIGRRNGNISSGTGRRSDDNKWQTGCTHGSHVMNTNMPFP